MEKMLQKIPPTLLFILSGMLMGLPSYRSFLWFLIFPGLVLLLWGMAQVRTRKRAFFLGWLAGSAKSLVVFVWVFSAYPFDWAGVEPAMLQIALLILYWILIAGVHGIGYGALGYVLRRFALLATIKRRLLFPLLLILAETVGSLIYSLIMTGPGGGLFSFFSHGYTGYALADHLVLKWGAMLGGVYALTIVVGLISVALLVLIERWTGLQKRSKNFATFGIFVLLVGGFVQFSHYQSDTYRPTRVAVFSTLFNSNILYSDDSTSRFARHELQLEGVEAALEENVEAIILPEASRLSQIYIAEGKLLEMLAAGGGVVLVDSVREPGGRGEVSGARIFDGKEGEVHAFDKQYFIPLGEYIPAVAQTVVNALPLNDRAEEIVGGMLLSPGISQVETELPPHIPNTIFCSEAAVPWVFKNAYGARENAPPYIAYVASHAWFTNRALPVVGWHQLDQMLKVHALWTGAHILEAANMAPTAHYLPDGTKGEPRTVFRNSLVQVDIVEL